MTNRLTASLREAPVTVPALAAVALFVAWSADQAGYPVTHWAPGGLVVLVLLAIAVATVGLRAREVPRAVKVALACLAAYTALSFLSILWAGVPGDAWDGADRTLLYLLVFALFAWWRQTPRSALLVLGAWTLAMICLGAFVPLHVSSATQAGLDSMLPGGRLVYPAGYANANAAEWLMAFWPALLLARSEQLAWALRGLFAGGAVLLAEVALLSQSRGSLYATPVMLLLVFALLPGRVRTFVLLVPVAAGVAAAAPAVLRVGNHLRDGAVTHAAIQSATQAMFLAAGAVALVVAAGAAIENRRVLSEATLSRVRTVLGACALAALVAAVAVGWAAAGDPTARIKHAWDTFKSPRGYAANATGSRLTSGLGSQRYDFYRVALDEFVAHPVVGIGADNFQESYLRLRHSGETPRYPHSIELRTLAQTGLLGALLALVGLAAALLAAMRAGGLRSRSARAERDPLARAVAVAALGGFAYWLVHGSFDWFFEFAGLGAPAFALLGLATALAPRGRPGAAPQAERSAAASTPSGGEQTLGRGDGEVAGTQPGRRRTARRLGFALATVLAVAAGASFAAPWLSGLQLESAAHIWARAPFAAYRRLDDSARLDPLSDDANLLAGSIAVRYRDLTRAARQFTLALGRVPGDAYATLELGAIASARGEPRQARVLLARAVRLNPRDRLARAALRVVTRGGRVDVDALNQMILEQARRLA
jgi:O-antigen ligase/polysaccharide polymerase Wzy-like membrane protein